MINHKLIISYFVSAVALLLMAQASLVNADQGATNAAATTAVKIPVPAVFKFGESRHVANGASLANRTSGTIHLRGVPADAVVNKAYLYFNYSDTKEVGADYAQAYINGHRASGVKVADNPDPCWGQAGNHTYRANVTQFLPKSMPNGDYTVSLRVAGSVKTPGVNPWGPPISSNHVKGATLVVIYKNNVEPYPNVVYLYDELGSTMFSSVGIFELSHGLGPGVGLLTMSGADGQRGASSAFTNNASNELTLLNGVQIAGPPVAASDWDGSDGLPLPLLWDTHTHSVSFAGGTEIIEYQAGTDCLVPIVFVLQI